jgi:hypothetical protein
LIFSRGTYGQINCLFARKFRAKISIRQLTGKYGNSVKRSKGDALAVNFSVIDIILNRIDINMVSIVLYYLLEITTLGLSKVLMTTEGHFFQYIADLQR